MTRNTCLRAVLICGLAAGLTGCAAGRQPEGDAATRPDGAEDAAAAVDAETERDSGADAAPPDDGALPTDGGPDACVPDCTGRDCGPNACGGSCGSCDGLRVDTCSALGQCVCGSTGGPCPEGQECRTGECFDPCGDPGVIPTFGHGAWNPALTPRPGTATQGADNIYAPSILQVATSLYLLWYGGQGNDGHDRIFLATSTDGYHFQHYPTDDTPAAVVDRGSANHVNDPSVVKVGDTYYMYYTEAATAEDDRIHLAISPDGVAWVKHGMVIDVGSPGSWDDFKVGRPSAAHVDGTFYVYYDGNDGTHRHVGLASSVDGFSFAKHPANPLVLHAGAVDVQLFEGGSQATVVMLREAHDGVYAHTSGDGVTFCDQGRIAALSGQPWDAFGQVTPHAWKDATGAFAALWVGGASHSCWCQNRIGTLIPQGASWPPHPSTGCSGCIGSHPDCTTACRAGGYGVDGFCANPGSTDPAACCACVMLP